MKMMKVTVTGTRRPVDFCPISVELCAPEGDFLGYSLRDESKGVAVPFQLEHSSSGCRLHWIVDSLAPGQRRRYLLAPSAAAGEAQQVKVGPERDGRIPVRIGAEEFTEYHFGSHVPRPVLYPVIGPFGEGVTRAYPMEKVEDDATDHVHHRSIWCAWGDVNGSDNWSEENGHGKVIHRRFEHLVSGPTFGEIVSINDWVDARGEKLMEDRLEYRFHCLPASMRLVDMSVTFYATEGDVRFGDTKEGGMIAIRVAAPMQADREGCIQNANGGMNEVETWGKKAAWCDYSGAVGGHVVGIAAFDHPANFRHPTYWHVRDYGLMTANPFGLSHFIEGKDVDGSLTLRAGRSLQFRYRILIHAGSPREAKVGGKYNDWLFPPTVSVQDI